MKASEIFVEYSSPIQEAVPAKGDAKELQTILSVPELVWNAIAMDENKNRKSGELPQVLKNHLITIAPKDRGMLESMLKFWVARKDLLFPSYNWPINVSVYKNLKQDLIIRVEVHEPKTGTSGLPKEWTHPKSDAKILPI